MAGLKKDSDWSLLFLEPSVINTVIDLLNGYNAYRVKYEPSEFLKTYFRVLSVDKNLENTKFQNFSKKHTKIQRNSSISPERRTTLRKGCTKFTEQGSVKLPQKLTLKTDNLKCSYPKLCEINAENLQIESDNRHNYQRSCKETNEIEPSDHADKKYFCSTCDFEDESSSSGIHSDTDDSESTLLPYDRSEFLRKQKYSVITENVNSDTNTSDLLSDKLNPSIPEKTYVNFHPYNNKICVTPHSSEIMENNMEMDFQASLLMKPDQFYLRINDDYQQAAVKMFLHIVDYKEFITITLKAFIKSTDTQQHIKKNISYFKVITYLLFFNLNCFTFNGIKNNLMKQYPEKCLQFVNFITSEIFQKNYDKFLLFYDQDFVKTYAFDHVQGNLVKKMRDEIQKCLEKPITTEIRRAEIIHKQLELDKKVNELSVLSTKIDTHQSAPSNVIHAKSVPKKIKHVSPHKTMKISQTCKEAKQKTNEIEEDINTQTLACEKSKTKKSLSKNRRNKSKKQHEIHRKSSNDDLVSKISENVSTCNDISKIDDTENQQKNEVKDKVCTHKLRSTSDVRPGLNNLHNCIIEDQTAQLPDICTLKSVTCDGCFTAMAPVSITHSQAKSTFDRKEDVRIRQERIQPPEEPYTKTKHINAYTPVAIDFSKPASKPPPDFSKVSIPVKPTAASVLREGACLRSNEIRILQNLEWIASGGADISAVEELVAKRREEKQQEELEAIERKHLQGLLSHEEAILARQQLLAKQRQNALTVKRQKEELEKLLQIFKKEEQDKIKILVEKTHTIDAAAREKPKEVQKMKSDTVQKMVSEAREQMAELQKQREEELMQRIALIRDLRALQELSKMKHKEIDLTETSGLGLLGEMSIAELHERLNLLKEELREEEKRKRDRAQYFRAQMKQHVQETQEYINQHRLNRASKIFKVNQMKKTKKIESEELKLLREKLTKTKSIRMGYPKEF